MVADSRYLEFIGDGDGIVLPVVFTFTLRPMSGPFGLITLVLVESKTKNDKRHADKYYYYF